MLMGRNTLPAYNMQAAADAEHALIVANTVTLDRQTVAASMAYNIKRMTNVLGAVSLTEALQRA